MIATLRVVRDPNGVLAVHEVFTTPTGEVVHFTDRPVTPAGYCPEQLRIELELFQRALDLPILTICNGELLT